MDSFTFLRPYGVAAVIDGVQLRTRDVNRDLVVSDILVAGDVQVSKAGGAFTNVVTLPTQNPAAGGAWRVELSDAEMTAPRVAVRISDQTIPHAFADVVIVVEAYGVNGAEYSPDWTNAGSAFNAQLLVGTATNRFVPVNQNLTRYAARSWFIDFNVVGEDSTGWDTFVFSIKRSANNQSDDEAELMIRVTNPAASDDGVIRLAGQPVDMTSQAWGAVVVSGLNPTIIEVHVFPGATDFKPADYAWELTRYRDGDADEIGQGVLTIKRGNIRGIFTP